MIGDIYNIAERLKKIDKRFTVQRNDSDGSFTIYQNGAFFKNVPRNEFDARVLKDIEKTIYINIYGDVFEEIDKHNSKMEKDVENKVADMSREMAKDMAKILNKGV